MNKPGTSRTQDKKLHKIQHYFLKGHESTNYFLFQAYQVVQAKKLLLPRSFE